MRGEDGDVRRGSVLEAHASGDLDELLLVDSVDEETREEATDELGEDVPRRLADREALEEDEADRERGREVASRNRGGDDDGEGDSEGVAETDRLQAAEAGLLCGARDEEGSRGSDAGENICSRSNESGIRRHSR